MSSPSLPKRTSTGYRSGHLLERRVRIVAYSASLGARARSMLDAVADWIAPDKVSEDDEMLFSADSFDAYDSESADRHWTRQLMHLGANTLIAIHMMFARAAATVDEFTQLWVTSRPRQFLRFGVLPTALAVAILLAMSSAGSVSRSTLIDQYRLAAALASQRGDDEAAQLWMQKVAWLDPNDPDYQYRLALGAERTGDADRADLIMRRIAPDDCAGYGPAHFWRAKQMVPENHRIPRSRVSVLRHHLQCAAAHSNRNAEAAEMLAQLEFQDGNVDAAISALEPAVRYCPELKLMLARLYEIQGDRRRASSIAESGVNIFRRRVEKEPDSVANRIQCARLLTFQGSFDRAVLVLQEGAARVHAEAVGELSRERRDDFNASIDQLRLELADVLIAWHDGIRRKAPHDYPGRLRVLQLAVNTVPTDGRVLERLALLAAEGRHGATEAREALADALASGTAPATVHLLLSMEAQHRHDRDAEERHLRLALALNPRLAAAANNLAWLLAHDERPDLHSALALVQQAAEVVPDHPEIRATRGVIYRKLGRTEDAIVDLESALAKLGDRADIHDELAGLYETLGDGELAERHRDRADAKSSSTIGTAG